MFSGPRFSVSVLSYVLVLCSYIVDHEMGGESLFQMNNYQVIVLSILQYELIFIIA